MAFTESWIETDPDGSIITVSLLDDAQRLTKRALRERLEGDPASSLSGVFEVGTFGTTAMVKAGSARLFTPANNAAALAALPLQDGRYAVALDSGRLYHLKGTGAVEIPYLANIGGVVAGATTFGGLVTMNGGLTFAAASTMSIVSGRINLGYIDIGSGFTAKILIDGLDGTVNAAEVGLAENGGEITFSDRAGFTFMMDNQNVSGAQLFKIRTNNAGANLWVCTETGAITQAQGLTVQAGGITVTGASSIAGALAMNANKITGLAAATVAGDAVRFEQAFLLGANNTTTGANTFGGAHVYNGAQQFTQSVQITSSATFAIVPTGSSGAIGGGAAFNLQYNLNATNTVAATGIQVELDTIAAAFTLAEMFGIKVKSPSKGAGSTITTLYGLYIDDQSVGTNNYAIYTKAGFVRFGASVLTIDGANGGPYAVRPESSAGIGFWFAPGSNQVGVHGNFFVDGQLTATPISANADGTAGNPAFKWEADGDNGLYRIGANDWALAAGSIGVLELDTDNTAQGTRMKIYDNTAAALVRVTRGAVDSGGVGFRSLRVPN